MTPNPPKKAREWWITPAYKMRGFYVVWTKGQLKKMGITSVGLIHVREVPQKRKRRAKK